MNIKYNMHEYHHAIKYSIQRSNIFCCKCGANMLFRNSANNTLLGMLGSAPFSSRCSTMMENPLPQGFRRAVDPSCGQKVRNDVMVNSECMLCMVVMM